ncbi:MAG: DUF4416 family protein [Desulfonatronovibrio sp.]
MSTPQIPSPGKLILSILSSKWDIFWPGLLQELEQEFGKTDYISDEFLFTQTRYYDQELDTPIFRRILSFTNLIPLDGLADTKLFINSLEQRFVQNEKRTFNLDPGIITLERLVLATGKNFTHRIYIGKGIWADLTLIFTKKDWKTLEWTFPDYASEDIKKHLRTIRNNYQQQLSTHKE